MVAISSKEDGRNGSELDYALWGLLRSTAKFSEREAEEILDLLLHNKELQTLKLDHNVHFGSLKSCRALGQLVRTSTTLKSLSLAAVKMNEDGLQHIVGGMLHNPQSALEFLDLSWNQDLSGHGANGNVCGEGAKLLADLLLVSSGPLLRLRIFGIEFSEGDMKSIAKSLAFNTTLTELAVGTPCDFFKGLYEGEFAWEGPGMGNPLSWILRALTPVEKLTADERSQLEGRHNETLRRLQLYGPLRDVEEVIARMLESNNSLEEFAMVMFTLEPKKWKLVFDSLKSNTRLQKLTLWDCDGVNDAFEDVMGLLHVNYMIKEISMSYSPWRDGRSSQIEAMLVRNKRLATYMNTLNENLELVKPSIGRLFLCGSPRAGKTTLRKSMVTSQARGGRRVMEKVHNRFDLSDVRTQGIEIRKLKGSAGEHIAIWDMAGQEEYRALHDSQYLFPEINQACMFLFVFRPSDAHDKGPWKLDDALDRLKKELHYWLSFINSNTRRGVLYPRVSVVLTHLDKLTHWFESSSSYVAWAKATIQEMRDSFTDQVMVHETIHAVSSYSGEGVRGVVDHVITIFGDLFTDLPKVPAACENVNLVLAKWIRQHKSEPIMTSTKFLELCKTNVKELKYLLPDVPPHLADGLPQAVADKHGKLWPAVISYLHDVGSIIDFQGSDRIVVDVNWLGQAFLGKLFNSRNESMQRMIPRTENGIVHKFQLQSFLAEFIKDGRYNGIDTDVLIELMKELKICEDMSFGDTNNPSYFMPSTLKDDGGHARSGKRKLQWSEMQDDDKCNPIYTGIRLQSTDRTRTFLSPGLFLRYQVHLVKKLWNDFGKGSCEYAIECNSIRVNHDGVEMLIESSGELEDGDYVDVLIRSEDRPTSEKHFAYKYGVSELRGFCASGEGCPGLSLQEAILRPECVEKLVLCIYRRNQAVSVESLKKRVVEKLLSYVEEKSEIWIKEGYANSISGEAIFGQYFKPVPEAFLLGATVKATSLLDDTNIKNAIFNYQRSVRDQVDGIRQANDEEQRVTNSVTPTISRAYSSSSVAETYGPVLDDYSTSQSPIDNQKEKNRVAQVRDIEEWGRKVMDNADRNTNKILQALDRTVAILKGEMKAVQVLHQERQTALMKTVDQILVVAQAQYHMPKIPYFTKHDVSLKERICAYVDLGTPFKLHFMCEEPREVHYVKDQEGLPIENRSQTELSKKLRPLIAASFKLIYILAKVGLHVGAGIGNVVPDFKIEATATSLVGETLLGESKMTSSYEVGMDIDFKSAWECLLEEIVGPVLQQQKIPQLFGLYLVHYKSNYLTKHLSTRLCWVCSECRDKAERASQLETPDVLRRHITPRGLVRKSDIP